MKKVLIRKDQTPSFVSCFLVLQASFKAIKLFSCSNEQSMKLQLIKIKMLKNKKIVCMKNDMDSDQLASISLKLYKLNILLLTASLYCLNDKNFERGKGIVLNG